jgi:hypothetical protein
VLRRRPMPAFIPARGRTPHLAGVCVNRIGTGSSLLLGIGVLQMFGKFSIDVPHSQLIFAAAN